MRYVVLGVDSQKGYDNGDSFAHIIISMEKVPAEVNLMSSIGQRHFIEFNSFATAGSMSHIHRNICWRAIR